MKKKGGQIGNQNAKVEEPMTAGFSGRCTINDKNKWVKQAQKEKLKLAQLITRVVNDYCDKKES